MGCYKPTNQVTAATVGVPVLVGKGWVEQGREGGNGMGWVKRSRCGSVLGRKGRLLAAADFRFPGLIPPTLGDASMSRPIGKRRLTRGQGNLVPFPGGDSPPPPCSVHCSGLAALVGFLIGFDFDFDRIGPSVSQSYICLSARFSNLLHSFGKPNNDAVTQ